GQMVTLTKLLVPFPGLLAELVPLIQIFRELREQPALLKSGSRRVTNAIVNTLIDDKVLAAKLIARIPDTAVLNVIGGIVLSATALMGEFGSMGDAIGRSGVYEWNRQFRTLKMDPAALLPIYWRKGEGGLDWPTVFTDLVESAGMEPNSVTALIETGRPIPGPAELTIAYLRRHIEKEEYDTRLAEHGLREQDLNVYEQITRPWPDLNTVVSLWNRGDIDDERAMELFGKMGV
ncbi:unnamed protein product, partial [marine sediment metagenome]